MEEVERIAQTLGLNLSQAQFVRGMLLRIKQEAVEQAVSVIESRANVVRRERHSARVGMFIMGVAIVYAFVMGWTIGKVLG